MVTENLKIKKSMKCYCIKYRDLINLLNVKYSTLASWINGYTPMPEHIEAKIEAFIEEKIRQSESKVSRIV